MRKIHGACPPDGRRAVRGRAPRPRAVRGGPAAAAVGRESQDPGQRSGPPPRRHLELAPTSHNARRPVKCQSAQASVGSDDKKSLLVTLGLPEDVAAAAVATDGSKGYKASKTRTALFYTLKVNDDAKPEWKQHFATYTAEAKASKGHINVSHSYNDATREVVCIDVLAGKDAMSNHIGNCFPAYARLLGAGVVMQEIVAVCDPAEAEWWATSLGAWQAERLVVTAADNCL